MLASESYEVGHRGIVAPLDISADKLPALGKANGIDSRGFGEDGMRGEVCANLFDLRVEVPQESCCAVG